MWFKCGHIKFHKTIVFRSHLQAATTAIFCTCNISFDFEPSFSIFEQTSSFEFHMQLAHNSKKPKFFGHHLTSVSGQLFQQEQNKRQCRNVTTKSLPWLGQPWLSRLTKNFKTVRRNTHLLKPMWSHQRDAQSPVLLPTTTHQHVFLRQSHLHSFDTDSGLLGKNVYYLQICSKGNGLLCPHQNKNIRWRQIAGFRYFCVFDYPTRQSHNWRGWVTLSWLLLDSFSHLR